MSKKLIIFLIFFLSSNFLSTNCYGQSENGQSGGFTAELDLSLFKPEQSFLTLKPELMRFRYIFNNGWALRLSSWGSFSSDQKEDKSSTYNSYFYTVRPGLEYHLVSGPGTFSAYLGIEGIYNQSYRDLDSKSEPSVTGAWDVENIQNFDTRGYKTFGGSLLGGADIYLSSNLYFGTEFGLAYKNTTHEEVKIHDEVYLQESATSTFEIDLTRVFRIGFLIN